MTGGVVKRGYSRSGVSQVQTGAIGFAVTATLLGAILAIAFVTPSSSIFGPT
ncbi:MAG: hypothetical protein V3U49_01920 [Nitrososphaerales archaeon]